MIQGSKVGDENVRNMSQTRVCIIDHMWRTEHLSLLNNDPPRQKLLSAAT